MQMTKLKKTLSLIVCIVLIAATALTTTGCTDNKKNTETDPPKNEAVQTEKTVLGEGETSFDFTVTDADGKETSFEIHTDKKMVGEALQELDLIAGDEGDYGLYVKTVNGMLADYDVDQTYWSFTIAGEMAMTGVDQTELVDGTVYGLVRTK